LSQLLLQLLLTELFPAGVLFEQMKAPVLG